MRVFNLEIFDLVSYVAIGGYTTKKNVYHHKVEDLKLSFDYFKKETNSIEVPNGQNIKTRQIVRIVDALDISVQYTGIVTAVEQNGNLTKVSFSDFLNSYADTNVVFDIRNQKNNSLYLENYLADVLYKVEEQNGWNLIDLIQTLWIQTSTTSVKPFNFNIKPDNENTNYAVVGFKNVLIDRSSTDYDVWINEYYDERYILDVVKKEDSYKYIETHAPYVISSTVRFEQNNDSTNRLNVINAENGNQRYYCLLNDGSIYFVGTELDIESIPETAVQPPYFAESVVKISEGDTFAEKAYEEAYQKLKVDTANNLIEIEVPYDTSDFKTWKIGQKVKVYHKDKEINTVLTGYKIDKTLTLIFGTVRLELTKRINRR